MKKHGFTLAEILITLGIIGVVAALTAPALIQNAGGAKIGPTLAKAVSSFEVANEQLLQAENSSKITSLAGDSDERIEGTDIFFKDTRNYTNKLADHLRISILSNDVLPTYSDYNGSSADSEGGWGTVRSIVNSNKPNVRKYITPEGLIYFIQIAGNSGGHHGNMVGHVLIDINGIESPNRLGKDLFAFALYDNGMLKPVGSSEWHNDGDDAMFHWKNGTSDQCNDQKVDSGFSCAGSIFENNLKVIYQ